MTSHSISLHQDEPLKLSSLRCPQLPPAPVSLLRLFFAPHQGLGADASTLQCCSLPAPQPPSAALTSSMCRRECPSPIVVPGPPLRVACAQCCSIAWAARIESWVCRRAAAFSYALHPPGVICLPAVPFCSRRLRFPHDGIALTPALPPTQPVSVSPTDLKVAADFTFIFRALAKVLDSSRARTDWQHPADAPRRSQDDPCCKAVVQPELSHARVDPAQGGLRSALGGTGTTAPHPALGRGPDAAPGRMCRSPGEADRLRQDASHHSRPASAWRCLPLPTALTAGQAALGKLLGFLQKRRLSS